MDNSSAVPPARASSVVKADFDTTSMQLTLFEVDDGGAERSVEVVTLHEFNVVSPWVIIGIQPTLPF